MQFMKNYIEEKQKMLKKWANLIFAFIALASLFVSLILIWLNS